MRRALAGFALGLLLLSNTGCLLNKYPSNPTERMETLIFESEDLRQIREEWKRFWFADQPSHLTYDRVHGGIQ